MTWFKDNSKSHRIEGKSNVNWHLSYINLERGIWEQPWFDLADGPFFPLALMGSISPAHITMWSLVVIHGPKSPDRMLGNGWQCLAMAHEEEKSDTNTPQPPGPIRPSLSQTLLLAPQKHTPQKHTERNGTFLASNTFRGYDTIPFVHMLNFHKSDERPNPFCLAICLGFELGVGRVCALNTTRWTQNIQWPPRLPRCCWDKNGPKKPYETIRQSINICHRLKAPIFICYHWITE